MRFSFITFRSVTHAQRGERLLQSKGIRAALQRTPRWMEAQGCGYSLRVMTENVEWAVQLLRQNGVPLRKVYSETQDGGLEETEV